MFDRNFSITIESDDNDLQLLSVVCGRAIRRLQYLNLIDALDLDDAKLLFDFKCLLSISGKSCCLGGLINSIGGSEFTAILFSLLAINWSQEETMLCAFLESLLPVFPDEDECVDAEANPSGIDPTDPADPTNWKSCTDNTSA